MPATSQSLPVGTAHQSTKLRSVAYIGAAAILAVFMLGFASTPKARAQHNAYQLYSADYSSKWNQPGTDASCCSARRPRTVTSPAAETKRTTAEVRNEHWWAKTD